MSEMNIDVNAVIKQAVQNAMTGMVQVMAGAAQEFADRTVEALDEMREESQDALADRQDAREDRQSKRLLARIERLRTEHAAVYGLLESADPASRAIITRRLEGIAGKIHEAAGTVPEATAAGSHSCLPAPTHRRVGKRFERVETNGCCVEN